MFASLNLSQLLRTFEVLVYLILAHCFQLSPNFDLTGVFMISLALVADAIIGNVQEKTIKQHNATNSEVNNKKEA